mmetsp:Transcript_13702/g.33243  ORF Transcript_13702/g.33243 Transcript_13702/m.33243 type:complete len:290 (+) Transcript_13702:53-922(+)|eukprot:CAMPEP_0180135666 /NCGR_PEP_ID=MMETSP0986-20121125/10982_1 /TAXON_ID=697907 /ORGANISM="non described non described, Strain CCMP2293" /LENGTH=289 /DNA_ID=CAMNT_0022076439 /DNA_START=53 /DNA_END=922 /DNA_ORIENTATION=-
MAEEEAIQLVAKADKKLKGGVFSSLFGGGNKQEAAVELLEEAANKYKQIKKWSKCGECHQRAAQVQLELNDKFGAATSFQAAFQALKKEPESVAAAVECLNQAIQLHLNNGRFTQAAKFHKEAAELFEAELNPEKALFHYQNAGDYYKGEDQTSSGNQCLLKVAVLSAELEDYEKAIDVFEAVAASSLDVALLKWSVKDYFFQAGLCRLALGDMLAARRAFDRYRDQDVSFSDTRESKLLEDLSTAYDDQDVEKFTDAIYEFDQISKLDKWKTSLLLRVKNALKDSDLT